jgi:nicotinamide-nucleotide amidase
VSIEIITIGREILDGRVIDTNSAFLGQELSSIGQVPKFVQRVDDNEVDMIAAFALAASRSKFVLVSGGLGPTSDDLTAFVFAKFLNKPFETNLVAKNQIQAAFERMKRPIISAQWKQAMLVAGAEVLENPHGTAPGFMYHDGLVAWFFMPGVPRELKPMFLKHVLPKIPADKKFKRSMWITQFTSEGELQQRLAQVIGSLPREISFFYRTRFPENHLGLSGSLSSPELEKSFIESSQQISDLLGHDVFTTNENQSLERVVIEEAIRTNQHICSVESCTGGLVSSRLTDVSGSSQVFWGSTISYSNDHKVALAESVGLGQEMKRSLETEGAVSKSTAELMAHCGARLFLAKNPGGKVLSVSTTGIAGPLGGTDSKPVGTCFISVSNGVTILANHEVRSRVNLMRDQQKLYFSQVALNEVRKLLLAL